MCPQGIQTWREWYCPEWRLIGGVAGNISYISKRLWEQKKTPGFIMRTSSSRLISIQTRFLINILRCSHNVTQNDLIILLWEPCAISTSRDGAKDAACRIPLRERALEAQASIQSKILWDYYEKIRDSWPEAFFANPDGGWMLSVLLEARRAPYKHELGRRILDGLGMFEENGKRRNGQAKTHPR